MRGKSGAGRTGYLRRVAAAAFLAAAAGCVGDGAPNPAGTFEAETVDVAPVESGRALRVAADEGDRVAAGDTLIVLDMELIALRRAETAAGKESLRAERAAATADKDRAARSLAHLETTLDRVRRLRDAGTATEQQVDDLTAERDLARCALAAARARLSAIDAESARLDAALDSLDLSKAARAKLDAERHGTQPGYAQGVHALDAGATDVEFEAEDDDDSTGG